MLFKGPCHRATVYAARAAVCGLCACTGLARASSGFTPAPFSDYQPILERMPFGAAPAAGSGSADLAPQVTDAQVQAEQQKLAQQINMSAINVTPDGATAIGFTDLGTKPPVNYYLLVGASAGGWSVVKADYDAEWAQIEKDGVTITLKLGKGLIDAAALQALTAKTDGAAPNKLSAPADIPAADASSTAAATPAVPLPPGLIRRHALSGQPTPSIPGLQRFHAEAGQAKEDLKPARPEGDDAKSYMARLMERKRQENAEKEAAEQASRIKLQELARKITKEELTNRENEMNVGRIDPNTLPEVNMEAPAEQEAALPDPNTPVQ